MIDTLFCGARWLGMHCLERLQNHPDVNVVGAVVPPKDEEVWWTDVVDEARVHELGVNHMTWEEARDWNIDLGVSVLTDVIFPASFLDRTPLGVLNLHPAPLPYYRGCNSYAHALMNDEDWYGTTLHYMDEEIDTGPIVDLYWMEVDPHDTGKTLYERAQRVALKLFDDNLDAIVEAGVEDRKVDATPQAEEEARYYSRDSLDNKEADPTWPREKLYNFIRALQFPPFEPAYFLHDDERIHLRVEEGEILLDLRWPENGARREPPTPAR